MPDYEFEPFVLTNHAKERMKLRGISIGMIAETLAEPHRTQTESDGDIKYIRSLTSPGSRRRPLHVIAFYNPNQKKWIVKTVFVRGENDDLPLKLFNISEYAFVPFVLTNHAKENMKLRRITTGMIAETLAAPRSTQTESDGGTKYIRLLGRGDSYHPRRRWSRELHVMAFYNPNQKKWIVRTVFVRGESDDLLLKLWNDFIGWIGRLFQ